MVSEHNISTNQSSPWSIRGAETLLERHPVLYQRWHYEPGVALLAVLKVWEKTRQRRYYDYIQRNMDQFITEDGNIRTYRLEDYNLDQINQGKLLFVLFAQTRDERYRKAAALLREQLRSHPRTERGGFWHKLIYPEQMWLDGLYMAAPFFAQYASTFQEPAIFDDIAYQVAVFDRRARDINTGLLYHAWDFSRKQQWANRRTGCSPHFWARAVGWFMMALPDILEFFPANHSCRHLIIQIFRDTAEAVCAVQDETSGVWYQILDQGSRSGNYLEASSSCMIVYSLVKGVRLGYLDRAYLDSASKGYQGILSQFIEVESNGWVNMHNICSVGGLGGTPYRDGSFEYYISEPVVSNDYKGFGPFIMASVEIERAEAHGWGSG